MLFGLTSNPHQKEKSVTEQHFGNTILLHIRVLLEDRHQRVADLCGGLPFCGLPSLPAMESKAEAGSPRKASARACDRSGEGAEGPRSV